MTADDYSLWTYTTTKRLILVGKTLMIDPEEIEAIQPCSNMDTKITTKAGHEYKVPISIVSVVQQITETLKKDPVK